jgi:hypothetical protein
VRCGPLSSPLPPQDPSITPDASTALPEPSKRKLLNHGGIPHYHPAWWTKLRNSVRDSPKTRSHFAKLLGLSDNGMDVVLRLNHAPSILQADTIARDLGYQIHVLPHGIDRPPVALPDLLKEVAKHGFTLVPMEAPTSVPRHERKDPDHINDATALAASGARVILSRDGHDIAAVIPLADLRRLEMYQPK